MALRTNPTLIGVLTFPSPAGAFVYLVCFVVKTSVGEPRNTRTTRKRNRFKEDCFSQKTTKATSSSNGRRQLIQPPFVCFVCFVVKTSVGNHEIHGLHEKGIGSRRSCFS